MIGLVTAILGLALGTESAHPEGLSDVEALKLRLSLGFDTYSVSAVVCIEIMEEDIIIADGNRARAVLNAIKSLHADFHAGISLPPEILLEVDILAPGVADCDDEDIIWIPIEIRAAGCYVDYFPDPLAVIMREFNDLDVPVLSVSVVDSGWKALGYTPLSNEERMELEGSILLGLDPNRDLVMKALWERAVFRT